MSSEESFFQSRAAILAAIPHRPPFLFIDQINELTDEGIVCAYRFKPNEFFFEGHYPNYPIVPGVILCEAAMQAGAIYTSQALLHEEQDVNKIPVVGRMNDIKFKRLVRPGDRIEIRASFKERLGAAYVLDAKVMCDGKLAVSFNYAVTVVERE